MIRSMIQNNRSVSGKPHSVLNKTPKSFQNKDRKYKGGIEEMIFWKDVICKYFLNRDHPMGKRNLKY